jgi:hypothetical protein
MTHRDYRGVNTSYGLCSPVLALTLFRRNVAFQWQWGIACIAASLAILVVDAELHHNPGYERSMNTLAIRMQQAEKVILPFEYNADRIGVKNWADRNRSRARFATSLR